MAKSGDSRTFAKRTHLLKNDIEIPEVKGVYIAAIQIENEEKHLEWWVCLINDQNIPMENIIINSRGYSDLETKGGTITASLRKNIKVVPAKSVVRLQPIMPEVFELFNEYWVMFFEDEKMLDRKYIFGPHTLDMRFSEDLPVLNTQGILVR